MSKYELDEMCICGEPFGAHRADNDVCPGQRIRYFTPVSDALNRVQTQAGLDIRQAAIELYYSLDLISPLSDRYEKNIGTLSDALSARPAPAEALTAEVVMQVVSKWNDLNRVSVPTPIEYLLEPGKPMLVDMQSFREFDLAMRELSAALARLEAAEESGE